MTVPRNLRPTSDYQAMDAAHHWHPFMDTADLNARGARVIAEADGVWLTDSEGNRILDAMSGLWCVNVGYGRTRIVEAVAEEMGRLAYYNTFFQCTHPAAAEFAEALTARAPDGMNRVFFTNSGSESNDTVFRMARLYWECLGRPRKKRFVARVNAYHGSSVASASLGGMRAMHAQSGMPIEGVHHINQPYWYGEAREDESPEAFGLRRAAELEQTLLRLGPETVAAFVAEPIQGAGGVVIPPDSYWPEIQRICRDHDVLLVADEVICGFGRTGNWWGSDTYAIEPDLMPIAKGMTSGYVPMGGVLISDRVGEALIAHAGEFFHGYTYSGHPAACAAGLANLAILEEEGLVERVADDIGPYLQGRWQTLADHPLVGEARMTGLIGAVEIVADKSARTRFPRPGSTGAMARDLAVETGVVLRAVGDTLVCAPPLVISREECDTLVARARRTLDALADRLGV